MSIACPAEEDALHSSAKQQLLAHGGEYGHHEHIHHQRAETVGAQYQVEYHLGTSLHGLNPCGQLHLHVDSPQQGRGEYCEPHHQHWVAQVCSQLGA